MNKYNIRWINEKDIDSLCELENKLWLLPCNGGYKQLSLGYKSEDFRNLLTGKNTPQSIGFIIYTDDSVCGFCIYRFYKNILIIKRIGYDSGDSFNFICNELKNKLIFLEGVEIQYVVEDILLESHILLKNNSFIASATKRKYFGDLDGYLFTFKNKKEN